MLNKVEDVVAKMLSLFRNAYFYFSPEGVFVVDRRSNAIIRQYSGLHEAWDELKDRINLSYMEKLLAPAVIGRIESEIRNNGYKLIYDGFGWHIVESPNTYLSFQTLDAAVSYLKSLS